MHRVLSRKVFFWQLFKNLFRLKVTWRIVLLSFWKTASLIFLCLALFAKMMFGNDSVIIGFFFLIHLLWRIIYAEQLQISNLRLIFRDNSNPSDQNIRNHCFKRAVLKKQKCCINESKLAHLLVPSKIQIPCSARHKYFWRESGSSQTVKIQIEIQKIMGIEHYVTEETIKMKKNPLTFNTSSLNALYWRWFIIFFMKCTICT